MTVFNRGRKVQVRWLLVAGLCALLFGTTGVVLAKTKRPVKRAAPAAAPAVAKQKHELAEPLEDEDNDAAREADAVATAPVPAEAQAEPSVDLAAPVEPVRTIPLRDIPPIPWWSAPARKEIEPPRPKPPTEDDTTNPSFAQTSQGPPVSAPTPTGVSWDGVGVGLSGFSPDSNPPDINGRVGATQYVQWNNTSFAVFNKSTGALVYGPATGNTLFQALGGACATHNDGDPNVVYDILAGRWILSQFVVGASPSLSHQCVAVSQTQDATGAYYLYDFVTDATNNVDYPHIGVWPDGYYMTAHVFNAGFTAQVASKVFVFERTQMIQGLAARMVQATLGKKSGLFQYGFLPSDLDSLTPPPAGEAAFVLGPDPAFTNRTDSTRVAVTWGVTPTIGLTEATIAVGIGNAPCVNNTAAQDNRDCVPQPSPALASDDLDNLSRHYMYRLAYRNFGGAPVQESLVVVSLTAGSASTPAHGALRWFEFRNAGSSTATPTSFQAATYDPDTAYRFLGSTAMDKDHNIALGYSKSSTSVLPGIFITGRLGTDTINTMGAEATLQAGAGVQLSTAPNTAGNRWGDYSSMTLDPVDQCTFYYTNEYFKTNGQFHWSTRVASYKFPSCTAAAAWGTVTGTITSCATGAPISGVTVTLSNGFAGASNASGVYSVLVPAGSYTATAANADRNCSSSSPSSPAVNPTSGGTTTQNFCMNGSSNLQANGLTFDDASGNANGVINSNECFNVNLGVKNAGCGTETAITGTLTSATPGVTIVQGSSTYANMVIDGSGPNATPFKVQTSNAFVCGTTISFSLNLTYAGGSKTVNYSVHTCEGGPSQTIPLSSLTAADLTQADRLGRTGVPSTCSGKTCPGGGFAGTKNYKKFTFTNTSGSAECFTVTINAAAGGAGDIESAAYLGTYDPANLCTNELGDTGIVGLGTTVTSVSYSFQVAALSNFVVVVNTTGTTTSSQFSGTVSGFVNTAAGPGACQATCAGAPNGTACDDGNACTQTDTCQSNVCVGGNPVVCTADQCHNPGTCNTGTGVCSAPTNKTNGTACNDANACTQTDTCQSGTCTGSNPVICTALDQCHDAGTCNPGTGVCSNPNKTNGTACNDANACTQTDTCQSGTCTGSNPVVCTALDQCHDAGTCNTGTGLCSNPNKTNGTSCNDSNACTQTDTCQSGTCTGSNPVVCTALDQCHDPGTCNTGTGVCSNPSRPDGAACTDGNGCTQTDTCQAGSCTGSNPVICNDSNPCTDDACNPANGTCLYVANDGNACTDNDVCTNDACSGGTCAHTPSGACGASGSVFYYRSSVNPGTEPTTKPVPNVGIDTNGDLTAEATTNGSGAYAIASVAGHVTLAPVAKYGSPRASDHNGAISSLDASLIARTAVGNATMSPNQRLAGDVTGNGTLSGLDASEVARFSVDLVDHFDAAVASGSDWKFLRCDAYAYPGNPGCGPAIYDYDPIGAGVSGQNFYALLYGEVTGNWQPATAFAARAASLEELAAFDADRLAAAKLRENAPAPVVRDVQSGPAVLTLNGWSAPLPAGQRRQVTIDIRNADGILALDLALGYDPSQLAIVAVEPAGIASGFTVVHGDSAGKHRISTYGVLPLSGSGSMLTVTIEAVRPLGRQVPLTLSGSANEGMIPVRVRGANLGVRGDPAPSVK